MAQSTLADPGPPTGESTSAAPRLPFVDALRAVAATAIVWHHLAFYGPLCELAYPVAPALIDRLYEYGRMAVQVFLVLGGYMTARTLQRYRGTLADLGQVMLRRYFRLGLPALAAVACAVCASHFARGWLPPEVVGSPPTLRQALVHVFFLQDLLGLESLSAGIWYVAIDLQLTLISMGLLIAGRAAAFALASDPDRRDALARRIALWLGWLLAAASLFYFNADARWNVWGVYYFAAFYCGMIVHEHTAHRNRHAPRAVRRNGIDSRPADGTRSVPATVVTPRATWSFWLYLLLMAAGLAWSWRPRLAVALATALFLYSASAFGWLQSRPRGPALAWLGRISYSLFLIHFPVSLVVSTLWVRLGYVSPEAALAGMAVSYAASLAAAAVFHWGVEHRCLRLSRSVLFMEAEK
jgi:peptidoglycan/LPS O-acetylase OafA/YrhL